MTQQRLWLTSFLNAYKLTPCITFSEKTARARGCLNANLMHSTGTVQQIMHSSTAPAMRELCNVMAVARLLPDEAGLVPTAINSFFEISLQASL